MYSISHFQKISLKHAFVKQNVFNFTQRIFAGNLSKEQSQKLFPCGEMFAISVSA